MNEGMMRKRDRPDHDRPRKRDEDSADLFLVLGGSLG